MHTTLNSQFTYAAAIYKNAGMVYVQTRHICIILYNNYIKHYIPSIFTYIYKPFGSQFLHIQICDIYVLHMHRKSYVLQIVGQMCAKNA